jgi:hypothetical protein
MSVDNEPRPAQYKAATEAKAHAAISVAYSADGLHKLPIHTEHIT